MSHEIRKLYDLLEIAPDCSDKELRDCYRALLRRHHPDVNQNSTDSTYLTQHLIAAYERVTEYRETYAETGQVPLRDEHHRTPFSGISLSFSITLGNPFTVSLSRILELKKELRDAWGEFETRQYDVKAALRFIRGALRGGRPELVEELLQNRTLIASAPFLAEIYNPDDAGRIALVWAQRLRDLDEPELAIPLLQDISGIGRISSLLVGELKRLTRSLHYNIAHRSRSGKPDTCPSKRIDHLLAIIGLGYEVGYIYKQIAEAFHELGDDEQARLNLQRALAVDPELTGAKTIMRALGFLSDDKPRRSASAARKIYLYNRREQIPSIATIIAWFEKEKWAQIIAYADLEKYAPRIIPSAREMLVTVASALGECHDTNVPPLLLSMLSSVYWDLRRAALLALAKVAGDAELDRLKKFTQESSPNDPFAAETVSYAEARLKGWAERIVMGGLLKEAEAQLRTEFSKQNGGIGRMRSRLEQVLENPAEGTDGLAVLSMLTRYCLRMQDWARILKLLAASQVPARVGIQALELDIMVGAALTLAGMHNAALARMHSIDLQLPVELRERAEAVVWDALTSPRFKGASHLSWAVHLVLESAIAATLPNDCLSRLHRLARVMEPIGEKDFALWLRHTLRAEAPGHYYGDSHDRLNYFQPAIADVDLRSEIQQLCEQYKTRIVGRIKEVLGEGRVIPTPLGHLINLAARKRPI